MEQNDIEELAGLQFEPVEIAIILEEEILPFLLSYGFPQHVAENISKKYYQKSELWLTMQRGRLRKEWQVRKSIFDMAVAGSSPAQTQALALITQSRIKLKLT